MQMLAACPGSVDYNVLIPDVDSLRLLTYRDLLLRLANPFPHAVYRRFTEVLVL